MQHVRLFFDTKPRASLFIVLRMTMGSKVNNGLEVMSDRLSLHGLDFEPNFPVGGVTLVR